VVTYKGGETTQMGETKGQEEAVGEGGGGEECGGGGGGVGGGQEEEEGGREGGVGGGEGKEVEGCGMVGKEEVEECDVGEKGCLVKEEGKITW